jgi:hypothetical protein
MADIVGDSLALDDCVAFFLELENRRDVVCEYRPFKGRYVPLDSPIQLRERQGSPGGGGSGLRHGRRLKVGATIVSEPKLKGLPAHRLANHIGVAIPATAAVPASGRPAVPQSMRQGGLAARGRGRAGLVMTTPSRVRLPNRRRAETRELTIGNMPFMATVGFDADDRPREVFLDGPKTASTMSAILGDAAVTISIALQFGIPAQALAKSVARLPIAPLAPPYVDAPPGAHAAASVLGTVLDLLVDFEASQNG